MKQPVDHTGLTLAKAHLSRDSSAIGRKFFQAKLTINQPDDVYEQEADTVAEQVMRMASPDTDSASFFGSAPVIIQRTSSGREEEYLHRRETNGAVPAADPDFEQYVTGLPGGGAPLSIQERNFFEPRFNRDFSAVRIHTDQGAAASAQRINALAYTTGPHIVFNQGQYQPDTDQGKRLLAHELTHVVQQHHGVDRSIQRFPDATDVFKTAFGTVVAPGSLAIKALITSLKLLPADMRNQAIKEIISKIISTLEYVKEPPEELKKTIAALIPGVGINPLTLWPLIVSALIGFYKQLQKKEGDELFGLIERAVDAQLDPMFYIGAMWGMVQGIGKWIKDIFDLIVVLGEIGVYMAVPPLFVYNYSDEIKKAWEAAATAGKWISDNKEALLELLNDPEALTALNTVAKDVINGVAEDLGGKAAEELTKTVDQGAYAMGEAGGKIIGYFIPDILLAVGTDGISGVLKGVQGIMKSVRATAMTVKEAVMVIGAIDKLTDGIKAMKIFAKGSKLGELGSKFVELLNELKNVFKGFKSSNEDLIKKIVAIAKKKGMPLDAAADNMYNIANLEQGLLHGDIVKSANFRNTIKILLDESHADWKKVYQSVTYTAKKGRYAEYDVIFEAIVHGKTLKVPRGFTSAEEFAEFSKEMYATLSPYGKDIKIQGSSTMNLSTKLKDIDIAIFADEAEFLFAMKKVWAKQFAKYYKLTDVPDPKAIDTKTFLRFLDDVEKTGKGNVASNGVRITGDMESPVFARKNGKIFGSELLTNANKTTRNAWVKKLGLEKIDISLIMRGKPFDIGPFITLTK